MQSNTAPSSCDTDTWLVYSTMVGVTMPFGSAKYKHIHTHKGREAPRSQTYDYYLVPRKQVVFVVFVENEEF